MYADPREQQQQQQQPSESNVTGKRSSIPQLNGACRCIEEDDLLLLRIRSDDDEEDEDEDKNTMTRPKSTPVPHCVTCFCLSNRLRCSLYDMDNNSTTQYNSSEGQETPKCCVPDCKAKARKCPPNSASNQQQQQASSVKHRRTTVDELLREMDLKADDVAASAAKITILSRTEEKIETTELGQNSIRQQKQQQQQQQQQQLQQRAARRKRPGAVRRQQNKQQERICPRVSSCERWPERRNSTTTTTTAPNDDESRLRKAAAMQQLDLSDYDQGEETLDEARYSAAAGDSDRLPRSSKSKTNIERMKQPATKRVVRVDVASGASSFRKNNGHQQQQSSQQPPLETSDEEEEQEEELLVDGFKAEALELETERRDCIERLHRDVTSLLEIQRRFDDIEAARRRRRRSTGSSQQQQQQQLGRRAPYSSGATSDRRRSRSTPRPA
ncbi:putative uncharacterized protein DDB_G0271606 [Trichogramma pretiosum]|uniref:putative uncharacterized protein DDB_G0271606 n=1 Tax=Trichogramma pretiosum TaxID=7493 RepID=UPI000C719C55|nr:putative uncharacterized protein DDB_G0271606 [Trichogramma pretiosum]